MILIQKVRETEERLEASRSQFRDLQDQFRMLKARNILAHAISAVKHGPCLF